MEVYRQGDSSAFVKPGISFPGQQSLDRPFS